MGSSEVLSLRRSPWQRAYVEREIGFIRRECLDHVIAFDEGALQRTLNSYFDYYHRSGTPLSLEKDSPEPRAIQPPEMGSVVEVLRSVDCITATNDGLPEKARFHHAYALLNWGIGSCVRTVLPYASVHRRIWFAWLGQSRKLLEACGPVEGDDTFYELHRIPGRDNRTSRERGERSRL
jgi:hypothetical protein